MPDELEALRQKRLNELMQQQAQQQTQQQMHQQMQEEQIAEQIGMILGQILTPDAKERLGNIRVARPEFARQVEILLIQMYRAGQLPGKLTDEKLKEILGRIHQQKKEIKITKV